MMLFRQPARKWWVTPDSFLCPYHVYSQQPRQKVLAFRPPHIRVLSDVPCLALGVFCHSKENRPRHRLNDQEAQMSFGPLLRHYCYQELAN